MGWQHPIDGPLARASPHVVAAAVVIFAAAYLWPFVDRGWIPHDEGTIAGDAVRVLQGELPHVGFQDPYIGGMTWFYAGLFRWFGVDLVTIRWALLVGALLSTLAWDLHRVPLRAPTPRGRGGFGSTGLGLSQLFRRPAVLVGARVRVPGGALSGPLSSHRTRALAVPRGSHARARLCLQAAGGLCRRSRVAGDLVPTKDWSAQPRRRAVSGR